MNATSKFCFGCVTVEAVCCQKALTQVFSGIIFLEIVWCQKKYVLWQTKERKNAHIHVRIYERTIWRGWASATVFKLWCQIQKHGTQRWNRTRFLFSLTQLIMTASLPECELWSRFPEIPLETFHINAKTLRKKRKFLVHQFQHIIRN